MERVWQTLITVVEQARKNDYNCLKVVSCCNVGTSVPHLVLNPKCNMETAAVRIRYTILKK